MKEAWLPSAAVVVPALNARATIEECVDSLLALRYPRELLEIVVVDNGSRDGTRAAVGRYGRVRIVDEARRGPGAARNAGVRETCGEVVVFTDADCTVDPDWLRELVEPLRDPTVGIVGGRILARRGANEAELYGETIHDHHSSILVWRPPYAITMSWASRRAVLEEARAFDERLRRVEDVDLSYRMGRAGYSLVYSPQAVVYHRNERSMWGLAREGWQHGFHAPPVLARHAEYIAEAREGPPSGIELAPRRVLPSRYGRAFSGGKCVGRAMGGVWFALRRSRLPTGSRA